MLRIAVVGATGAVGRECLKLLDRGTVPVGRVVPVASPRSLGRRPAAELGLSLAVDPMTTVEALDPRELDVAVFCAGAELSSREAERLAAAGVLVVDNTSAFRMRPDVPLVVPQVNPAALARRPAGNLVANPNCSTIQLVRALHPLHELAELEGVVVATYQAASGGGLHGLAELAGESARLLADPEAQGAPNGRFGQPLAFNLVPEIGLQDDTGLSHEERKLVREPRKILGLPDLRVSATAVRVPVFHCHSEAAHIRLRRPVSTAQVEQALADTPGLRVYRRSDAAPSYPMPRTVFADDESRALVHVGRIRVEPQDPRSVAVWIVADNLWVGAALNAVQIVELAVKYGWLS
ncbi:aspartate-semialdehyde dehydrogenase [Kitasatospora sp. RB6PN24]|uniref:aspartate-semialdehyde dehydrogenase n=1 Tax=Kitasatospora humi TaxID=2893891 RepID=UPI001E4EAADB|nr:aspartate-semialdehyde dehydrogenase [Kitasatospora humi]MCC9308322.1 aspartate-semialdehyde dehydrogenase [Kitasatospora humi]